MFDLMYDNLFYNLHNVIIKKYRFNNPPENIMIYLSNKASKLEL